MRINGGGLSLVFGWCVGGLVSEFAGDNYYYLLGLLISISLSILLRWRESLGSPRVIILLLPVVYMCIGSPNISSYRGEIQQYFYIYLALLISCIVLAVELGWLTPSIKLDKRVSFFSLEIVLLTMLPGLVGVAMLLPQGVPLLQPWKFTSVSAKATFLIETLFVPFCLCVHNFFQESQPKKGAFVYALLAFLILLMIALPGYRGWVVIAFFLLGYGYVIKNRGISFLGLSVCILLVFLVMTGLAVFRRAFNPELIGASEVVINNNAEHLGETFALLHFSLRESIAISQRLFESGVEISNTLFFSDFLTMLPGKHVAGGELVAQAYGDYSGVGLTPGALGALTIEFGVLLAFFFISSLAFLVAYFTKVAHRSNNLALLLLAVLISLYFVHFLHRGIPKPGYIIIPLYFGFVYILCRRRVRAF